MIPFILLLWMLLVGIPFGQEFSDDIFTGAPTLVLDNLQVTLSTRLLLDIESPSGKFLHGYLGWQPRSSNPTYVSCTEEVSPDTMCFQYGRKMKLIVKPENMCDGENCHSTRCHRIQWDYHLTGSMDCFLLGDESWYGGGERLFQRWPLQNDSRPWHAYVTGDPAHHPAGSMLENLWLTSSGFMIFIDRDVPLFLSLNESNNGKLCFSTSLRKHPYKSSDYKDKKLSYSVCSSLNIQESHRYAIKHWLKKPLDIPDERMLSEPIWSTWARYKTEINQDKVVEFAEEIKQNGFSSSQIEVDDKWQGCYGDLSFDTTKFPDPQKMVQELKKMGQRITLWVHPFCNVDCATYSAGEQLGYWVKDTEGKPVNVTWWDGVAAMLDITNDKARDWYVSRLQVLKAKYGIDSFKFDAGEVSWLQEDFVFHDERARSQPNLFTRYYNEMASRLGSMVEVRSGWNSQELPMFFRMYDKDSKWSYANGLKTVIPTALHFSLMGYHFILPDMVGGNNYGTKTNSLPKKELYIRWLQVNVFLPAIQFSILPWQYDEEVMDIALKMMNLRNQYIPYLMHVCKKSVQEGSPVIRPLWWASPEDPVTWNTDSQFMLGDEILVAPVLEKGKRERDVYIPEGQWFDVLRKRTVEGPTALYDYKVPLAELSFFIRLCDPLYNSMTCKKFNPINMF